MENYNVWEMLHVFWYELCQDAVYMWLLYKSISILRGTWLVVKCDKMEEVNSDIEPSSDGTGNVYYNAFEKHYKILEQGLPMDSLFATLISAGLLRDTQLQQKIESAQGNTVKARFLLESMSSGLKIGNNEVFITFVKAIKQYADESNDQTVKQLVENMCKDLPGPLSELQNTTGIVCNVRRWSVHTNMIVIVIFRQGVHSANTDFSGALITTTYKIL